MLEVLDSKGVWLHKIAGLDEVLSSVRLLLITLPC